MWKLGAGLGFGSGALGAGALCVVLLGAGIYIQQERNAARDSEDASSVDVQKVAASKPTSQAVQSVDGDATTADASTPDSATQAPEIMTAAPAFDEVRREADGMTVIAGRGLPGATVRVLQNGEEIATSTVDRSGKFATIALIPPDGRGHSLSLSQIADGAEVVSESEVLLAPIDPVVPSPDAPTAPTEIAEAPTAPTAAASVTAPSSETPQAPAAPTAIADAPVDAATVPAEPRDVAALTNVPATDGTDGASSASSSQQPSAEQVASAAPAVQDTTETVALATPIKTTSGPIAELLEGRDRTGFVPQKPKPPVALRSTAEGVEILNAPAPEVMDNVALDTISYSAEGEVQLSGRAQSEAATVRVYLNNNAKVDLPVDAQGRWRGDVPDVDEGIYTLRVDEVTSDGKVSSRVETPFKREPIEVLAAAAAAEEGPIKAITVQKGATLWAIARDRYGAGELYVRVFEANKDSIRDPDLIYPGQIFELPQ